MEFVLIGIAILVVALVAGVGLLVSKGRRLTRLDDDAATGTTLTRPRPPAPVEEPRPSGATTADQRPPPEAEPETAEAPPAPPRPPPGGGREAARAPAGRRAPPRRARTGAGLRDPAALGGPAGAV